jgi:hypothetical protein
MWLKPAVRGHGISVNMPRFRREACPGLTRIIGIVGVWVLRGPAPGKFGMLVETQTAVGTFVPKRISMADHRVPQWHPISALPMIAQALDGMVESAEDVLQSLEQARPRPQVLDDYTIDRVREAHGTQLNDVWWYTEQLARWQRASPTSTQQQELGRLTHQLTALRRVLTASLALAEELQAGTIEKVLAKDDVELAMEFLLGKRKP